MLVDDDQVVVLVDQLERDGLRGDLVARRRRQHGTDHVALAQLRRGLGVTAIDGDGLLPDEPLERRAAEERDAIDEVPVKALLEVAAELEADADRGVVIAALLVEFVQRGLVDLAAAGDDRIGGVACEISVFSRHQDRPFIAHSGAKSPKPHRRDGIP